VFDSILLRLRANRRSIPNNAGKPFMPTNVVKSVGEVLHSETEGIHASQVESFCIKFALALIGPEFVIAGSNGSGGENADQGKDRDNDGDVPVLSIVAGRKSVPRKG
jgi:hypothetical protein